MERTRQRHLELEIIILIEPLDLRIQCFFACMHFVWKKVKLVSHRQKGSERCFRFDFTKHLKWRGQQCKDAAVYSKTSLKQIFVFKETIANIWKPWGIYVFFVTILLPVSLPSWRDLRYLCCLILKFPVWMGSWVSSVITYCVSHMKKAFLAKLNSLSVQKEKYENCLIYIKQHVSVII